MKKIFICVSLMLTTIAYSMANTPAEKDQRKSTHKRLAVKYYSEFYDPAAYYAAHGGIAPVIQQTASAADPSADEWDNAGQIEAHEDDGLMFPFDENDLIIKPLENIPSEEERSRSDMMKIKMQLMMARHSGFPTPGIISSIQEAIELAQKYGTIDDSSYPLHTLCALSENDFFVSNGRHLIDELCQLGCDIDRKSEAQNSPIMVAIKHNNFDAARHLLTQYAPKITGICDKEGMTPFMLVVKSGNQELITTCLALAQQQNLTINERNDFGGTALGIAYKCLEKTGDCVWQQIIEQLTAAGAV